MILPSKTFDINAELKGTTGVRTIDDFNSSARCCMASRVTALISNLITSHAVQIAHFPFLDFLYGNNNQIDPTKQAVLNTLHFSSTHQS
jgi:hypothetical protein